MIEFGNVLTEFEKIEYIKSSKKKLFKKNNWKAGGNSKGGGTFALIDRYARKIS